MTSLPRTKVFISYSDKDATFLERLQTHLAPAVRDKFVDPWDNTKLAPGTKWRSERERAIQSAKVAVVLVSADYLASEATYNDELLPLLSARSEGVTVLPVLLRPCPYEDTPLAEIQFVNKPLIPLERMTGSQREETWMRTAKAVTEALKLALPPSNVPIQQEPSDSQRDQSEVKGLPVPDKPGKDEKSPAGTLRHISESKIAKGEYDVFLCYNREDKASVKGIGNRLLDRGIAPWLDMWEIPPGRLWQREIELQIQKIPVAAVFVGKAGIGPWHRMEIEAFLRQLVQRGCPVIPVLLPDAPTEPDLPIFLGGMGWVDFRESERQGFDEEEDPLRLLIWGITGRRVQDQLKYDHSSSQTAIMERSPSPDATSKTEPSSSFEATAKDESSKNVLVASLGESPVVVSAMYDLLTVKKQLKIDKVIVLLPGGKEILRAYKLVQEALPGVEVQCEELPFEDADGWQHACTFLQRLYRVLETAQTKGEKVYLSPVGGRKSMSALMAWIVPFFSCVEHIYHVIDKDEEHFPLLENIRLNLTDSQRYKVMHPDIEQLILVDIPFERERRISKKLTTLLLSATHEDLDGMQYEETETATLLQAVTEEGKILNVQVTRQVAEQFRVMCKQDVQRASELKRCFEEMSFAPKLQSGSFNAYRPSNSSVTLHFFRSSSTALRLVFYTDPEDIASHSEDVVKRVIVCSLETGANNEYRTLEKIAASPGFSLKPEFRFDELPPVPYTAPADSILIVPLGKFPMVATQLYTLLEYQEKRTIREVYLVYPERAIEIDNAARLVKSALQERAGVPCHLVPVKGLEDIDSEEACRSYQAELEKTIAKAKDTIAGTSTPHGRDYKIDLALSGGRKGMTAMTIFAAQRQKIPFVYHALVTDEQLDRVIEDENTVEKLQDLSRKERNARLFLDAYKDDGPYGKFVLFKVPVF